MSALGALLGLLCAAGGVGLLRAAWRWRGSAPRLVASWALVAAGAAGWRVAGAAWDKAVALTLLSTVLAALAVLAATAQWPGARARPQRLRTDRQMKPPDQARQAWRAWARAACAGPLAMAAAIGCGAWMALRGPGDAADRLVAAGFVMPLVWAAAGVWATTDERLGRVCMGLVLLGALALGTARP